MKNVIGIVSSGIEFDFEKFIKLRKLLPNNGPTFIWKLHFFLLLLKMANSLWIIPMTVETS